MSFDHLDQPVVAGKIQVDNDRQKAPKHISRTPVFWRFSFAQAFTRLGQK
ncbi:hypothetical protein [Lentilactobacillus parakefiri]